MRWARIAATTVTLAFLVWRLGTGPFLDGLRTVDGGALAAAAGLAALTTVCCAWRWRVVARGLGVELRPGTAVAAYYRSLFLNVTLPGGMVGDVHRGISHGRDRSRWGGCATPLCATCAAACWLGKRGRPSRSLPRWSWRGTP